mgnify:FL=1
MRQVKLYTLKEDVVVVTGDHINFHNYPDRPIRVRGSDEFIIDAPFTIKQVGAERYVEFGRNTQEKEHLVAFDPEIRKLLGINEQKLKDELTQMKRLHDGAIKTNETLVKYKNDLLKENGDLVEKLNAYSFITFWQRLLFLFTGKVGDTK